MGAEAVPRRGPGAALPLLLGAGTAFLHAALLATASALFWPTVARALGIVAVVGAGAGCLGGLREGRPSFGVPALPGPRRFVIWLLAAAGTLPALERVARTLLPGTGLGLGSFPAWFLLLVAIPGFAAGGALVRWSAAGQGARVGWFAAGAGGGLLLFALLPAAGGPRIGSPRIEIAGAPGAPALLSVDRGQRADVIAPREPAGFPFEYGAGPGGRIAALAVGFPSGPLLAALLERPGATVTILDEDGALAAAVAARWPAFAEALRSGRATLRTGSPRAFLARDPGRFDVILLAEIPSYGALRSGALNFTPDYRYTVAAFRSYLDHLEPTGLLAVERNGMARAVSTLRAAAGLPREVFAERLAVLGRPEQLFSAGFYRPAGFLEDPLQPLVYLHSPFLYRPNASKPRGFYYPLVGSARVQGLSFSSPLDLSPPLDSRPFFDHLERTVLSPPGWVLPEEWDPAPGAWRVKLVPAGDRPVYGAVLAALALAAVALLAGARSDARPAAPGTAVPLWSGAAAAFGLEAYRAWAGWLAPTAAAGAAAGAATVAAFGLGWVASRRSRRARPAAALLLAGAFALGAAGAYRCSPALPRLGAAVSTLVIAAVGILLGALAGRVLRGAFDDLGGSAPPVAGWWVAVAVIAAVVARAASPVIAVNLGYTVHWALASVATLAAVRAPRRVASPAAGALPPGRPT
jgi:hypothetical protein